MGCGLRRCMTRICKTTPRDGTGRPLRIRDLKGAENFIDQFSSNSQTVSGSFSRYTTVNGYSSYSCVEQQPVQGLLKSALADIHVLARRAKSGDQEAQQALEILESYHGRVTESYKAKENDMKDLTTIAREALPVAFKGKAVFIPMTVVEVGILANALAKVQPILTESADKTVCSYMGIKLIKALEEANA